MAGAAHAVEASGVKAFILPCDVVDADAMEAAAEQTERDLNCSVVWSRIATISVFLSAEELATLSDQPTKKPRQGMRIVCAAGLKKDQARGVRD